MKLKSLYERLKPGIKATLESSKEKYPFAVKNTIKALENNFFIGDLTITDVSTLIQFGECPSPQLLDYSYICSLFEQNPS